MSTQQESYKITENGIEITSGGASQAQLSLASGYDGMEAELQAFEEAERHRLGLADEKLSHWVDPNPQTFTRSQRNHTTVLVGGLTFAQDLFLQAALEGVGYHVHCLEVPDTEALHFGKEFGNRGQCNPTYFTVGNLIKYLVQLRDEKKFSVTHIVENYLFFTAGACGPCRFGTYVTEYRKALRDAGFAGFRVMLVQQTGGLKQATGEDLGLELNPRLCFAVLKAVIAGDVLNANGYRIRPYEVVQGTTEKALADGRVWIASALKKRTSILVAMWKVRRRLARVKVDRLQAKPKVSIIGEFWAMTTEGDGNYHLQKFLESEGAEVDVQLVTAWLLYNIWILRYDTRKRMTLRGEDGSRFGLAGVNIRKRLINLWLAEVGLKSVFKMYANFMGLSGYHLPDQDEIARLAKEHYPNELRGGEGHMEVGKLIQTVIKKKAHMVVSVKPFGCMPSSGVSDGVQSLITKKHPEAIFCAIETSGDGAVNVQSRVQMFLFKARKKAREELDQVLQRRGWSLEKARICLGSGWKRALNYPKHRGLAGTGANVIQGD